MNPQIFLYLPVIKKKTLIFPLALVSSFTQVIFDRFIYVKKDRRMYFEHKTPKWWMVWWIINPLYTHFTHYQYFSSPLRGGKILCNPQNICECYLLTVESGKNDQEIFCDRIFIKRVVNFLLSGEKRTSFLYVQDHVVDSACLNRCLLELTAGIEDF